MQGLGAIGQWENKIGKFQDSIFVEGPLGKRENSRLLLKNAKEDAEEKENGGENRTAIGIPIVILFIKCTIGQGSMDLDLNFVISKIGTLNSNYKRQATLTGKEWECVHMDHMSMAWELN